MNRRFSLGLVVSGLLALSTTACSAVTGLDDLIFDLSDDASEPPDAPIESDECESDAGTDPDDVCSGGVCDGHGHCATGELQWYTIYSGSDLVKAYALAATDERVAAAGQLYDEVQLGDTAPYSGGEGSAWNVVLDAEREASGESTELGASSGFVSAGSFGDLTGTGRADAAAIAFDPDGALVMAGHFSKTLDIDPTSLEAVADYDLFVARFAESDNSVVWSKALGNGDKGDLMKAMALDSGGDIVISGHSDSTTINFGGGPIPRVSTGTGTDIFLAKLRNPDGDHRWSQRFGPLGLLSALAVDSKDNIILVGTSYGAVNFGGDDTRVADLETGMFIAKLNGDGEHVWSKSLGGGTLSQLSSVAIGPDDAIVVGGWFDEEISLGTVTLEPANSDTGSLLVAQFDAGGQLDWPRKFDLTSLSYYVTYEGGAPLGQVATDSAGNVVVVGNCAGTVPFDADEPLECGESSAFITKLGGWSSQGDNPAHLWSRSFAGDTDGSDGAMDFYRDLEAVAVSPNGSVYAAGHFRPDITIDGDSHTVPQVQTDAVLLKLSP